MIKYVFREKPVAIPNAAKASPQVIGEALAKISERNNGQLKPDAVWKEAKASPRHPLHKFFTWDVQKAAEAHWRDQARTLIRCVDIVSDGNKEPAPAFLSIADRSGVSYRTTDAVLNSHDLQVAVLKAAQRDLEAFEKRYRRLEDICDIVRDAKGRLADRISKHESRVTQ